MIPKLPKMVRWPDAVAERKTGSDGPRDVALGQGRRFRDAVTERKLACES